MSVRYFNYLLWMIEALDSEGKMSGTNVWNLTKQSIFK